MSGEGARARQVTFGPRSHYVPYFYNPPVDRDGRRLLCVGRDGDEEQAFVYDLGTGEGRQVTSGRGTDMNWAPYIRQRMNGIRPQFVLWSRPDWERVVYWDGPSLRRVHVDTGRDEELLTLDADRVPSVPHCSPNGWVCFGYMPRDVQDTMRDGASVDDVADRLGEGCGFIVYDLVAGALVCDVPTPFWPNHVAASPDHRRVLYCREGSWHHVPQRMHVYDLTTRATRPLRPQGDGAHLGHEFWISPTVVGYHGMRGDEGLFGTVDVETGACRELPVAGPIEPGATSCHYHTSPDARMVVTDGGITVTSISVGELGGAEVRLRPLTRHNWARDRDQRFHPHPHWHEGGRLVTYTGGVPGPRGEQATQVFLLEL